MPLYRKGDRYLVYHPLERAYLYDAATGAFSPEFDPSALIAREGRDWRPVPDDAQVPGPLLDRLVLKLPSRG